MENLRNELVIQETEERIIQKEKEKMERAVQQRLDIALVRQMEPNIKAPRQLQPNLSAPLHLESNWLLTRPRDHVPRDHVPRDRVPRGRVPSAFRCAITELSNQAIYNRGIEPTTPLLIPPGKRVPATAQGHQAGRGEAGGGRIPQAGAVEESVVMCIQCTGGRIPQVGGGKEV